MLVKMASKRALLAHKDLKLRMLGIMALFSINGRSGEHQFYAPLKIQKCNFIGVSQPIFSIHHSTTVVVYGVTPIFSCIWNWQEIDWKIVMHYWTLHLDLWITIYIFNLAKAKVGRKLHILRESYQHQRELWA